MTDDLPDAELEVLAALWRCGDLTARQIRELLAAHRVMSHAAVFTLLTRLEEKGYVRRTGAKVGKAFVYRARTKPGRTYRKRVRALVDRLFGGDAVQLVSSLFEEKAPTPEQIDDLQALLDDLRAQRRDGGGRR